MHFHFCQKCECLGAKNVVLHRPSVHFGLGTVSCGNALLPLGRNVTSTNTGKAATIHQPEEHPGLLMAICWFPPKGSIPPQFPKCSVFLPKTCKFPPGGPCGPRLRITGLMESQRWETQLRHADHEEDTLEQEAKWKTSKRAWAGRWRYAMSLFYKWTLDKSPPPQISWVVQALRPLLM